MTDWQPIECAPKDGTTVLLYPMCMTASWDCHAENWLVFYFPIEHKTMRPAVDWKNATAFYDVMADAFGDEPTHWMPLPAPPKETP